MESETSPKKWVKWAKAVAVGLTVIATWFAAQWAKDDVPESAYGMSCAANMAILEQKKRCGFVDLGQMITITGQVKRSKTHKDGDRSIDIYPDDEFEWVLYYKGHSTRDYIHTEFTPCERSYEDVAAALEEVKTRWEAGEKLRVAITGRWAYDGVDHRGEWREQLDKCLDGLDPDPSVGWLEIHPAYSVEVLD
jgi:hypothetical protein